MTQPPLSNPPKRSWRRAPRALIAGVVVTALCLAAYAWLTRVTSLGSSKHHAAAPGIVTQDDLVSEGFSFGWPEDLVATGMFQCGPVANRDVQAAVVVWTDKANKVVAFGAAQEGVPLPAYAAALEALPVVEGDPRIHLASAGYALRISKKKNTLQVNDMKLDCVRNSDD